VRQPLASFFSLLRRPRCSTLFPYTTLFRSFRALRRYARHSWTTCWSSSSFIVTAPRADGLIVIRLKRRLHYFSGSCTDSRNQIRSEEHTSELQSPCNLVCRLLLEKKNNED